MFNSFLAPQMNQYLAYRKALGYELRAEKKHLRLLDQYLVQSGADAHDIAKPGFFLELRKTLCASACTVNTTMAGLSSFFQFLIRYEYCRTNPLVDIPALPTHMHIAFVFSDQQTTELLNAVCARLRYDQRHFLIDMAIYLAILMLARCGMRIAEPLRLKLTDYRPQQATLYIRKTKFSKDRIIPVENCVAGEINNYLSLRKTLLTKDTNAYLLAGRKQKKLYEKQIRKTFYQAVADMGLRREKQTIGAMCFAGPVPHSLRHSFAINTLNRIRHRGDNAQHALPALAAYMGHCKYQYTAAYLKVTDAARVDDLIEFAKSFKGL